MGAGSKVVQVGWLSVERARFRVADTRAPYVRAIWGVSYITLLCCPMCLSAQQTYGVFGGGGGGVGGGF